MLSIATSALCPTSSSSVLPKTKSSSHLTLAQSFAATSPLYSHQLPSQPTSSFRSQYRPRMEAGQLVFGRPSTALRADRWGSKHFLSTLTTVRSGAANTSMIITGVPEKCTSQSEPFFFTLDSIFAKLTLDQLVPFGNTSRSGKLETAIDTMPRRPEHSGMLREISRSAEDGQRMIRKQPGRAISAT